MSRFSNLYRKLGLIKAISFYIKVKTKKLGRLSFHNLSKPFSIRNNPYDYATFEEVILNEAYNIEVPFSPEYIIDGGGNIGLTACYFATKYPKAIIISVEPDAENYKTLKTNTSAYKKIIAIKSGIWKKNSYLKIIDSHVGNNAFTVTESPEADEQAIKAVGIYNLMIEYNFPKIDILKLDIEGSEKELFETNFEDWLPKTKILIIELHDAMKTGCSKSVFNAISKYDFSFSIKGENIIFTNNAII